MNMLISASNYRVEERLFKIFQAIFHLYSYTHEKILFCVFLNYARSYLVFPRYFFEKNEGFLFWPAKYGIKWKWHEKVLSGVSLAGKTEQGEMPKQVALLQAQIGER